MMQGIRSRTEPNCQAGVLALEIMARASSLLRFDWAGQGLAIDLADTLVARRPGEFVDHLSDAARLSRWLELEREWLGPVRPSETPALAEVHKLREAVRGLFFAAGRDEALPLAPARVLNRFSAGAAWHRQLDLSDPAAPRLAYARSRSSRASQVLAAIADAAIELLAGPDRQRIRVCAAPSCGMFYLERKAGHRWCSVSCGNRARVARHYDRSKAAAE
jgi:predicted RNA-binding Zn ribbon-like protein